MLVHESVHQIAVLGQEVWGGGGTVIRAHNRIKLWIAGELGDEFRYCIGVDADVGIEEKYNFAPCCFRPQVSRPRGAKPAVGREHLRLVLSRYSGRIIGRPVVHDDAFQGSYRRGTQALQALLEVASRIVDGDNYRNIQTHSALEQALVHHQHFPVNLD
jgi:hypothetical protein